MCPVALLADAVTWLFRAGLVLTIRLTSAVALAATAFSAAILVSETFDGGHGAIASEETILSEVIDRTLYAEANGSTFKVAVR